MPIVTINDYDTYNSTRQHPFSRQCPNLRSCFPTLSRSFNPFTQDRPLMLRRVAFLLTIGLRFVHLLFFSYHYFVTSLWGFPISLLNTLFFFFVAWNLHLIVEMVGERKIFGRKFGRGSFDAFLWIMVIAHSWVVAWDMWLGVEVGGAVWSSFDLVIFAVAWVATWDPEDGGLSLP